MSDRKSRISETFDVVKKTLSSVSGGLYSEKDLEYIVCAGLLGSYLQVLSASMIRLYELNSGDYARMVESIEKTNPELYRRMVTVMDLTIDFGEVSKKVMETITKHIETQYRGVDTTIKIPPEMIN